MNIVESEKIHNTGNFDLPAADVPSEKFISVELGGRLCWVAASEVVEVVQPMTAAAVPNSPAWLSGLAAYRGKPVAVIDPAFLFDRPSNSARSRKAKVLVFRSNPENAQFALPVEAVRELVSVRREDLQPDEEPSDGKPFRTLMKDGHSISLIDHNRLFASFSSGHFT